MGRTGDSKKYLDLIASIRSAVPDAVIRSTIMLGFPGEDRQAFDVLMRFIEEARLDWMGSFLYSREEDTPHGRCAARRSTRKRSDRRPNGRKNYRPSRRRSPRNGCGDS
jgi:ribosomal protein S12 methylthiotransferase